MMISKCLKSLFAYKLNYCLLYSGGSREVNEEMIVDRAENIGQKRKKTILLTF